ncbi:MAG TPA: hypothetical protein PLB89_04545 [Flavobacteriales bacterium]|nr:hypothetical protein [Flavobacteriales bacterium]
MTPRRILPLVAILIATLGLGQTANVQVGKPFTRIAKGATGDLHTVVAGVLVDDSKALLYVEDGLVHKVVRLDAQLLPTDELALNNYTFDGLTWNGLAPFIVDGTLHCLLASQGKKATEYAIGAVNTSGAPALAKITRVATSELPLSSNASNSLAMRSLPDPILFNKGLSYAQSERIIASPDGQHFLLNNFTLDEKGNKRFWCAYLDRNFKELWSGTKELPYMDLRSRIHQISLANDGTVHLLTYLYRCETEEQVSDKMCHEIHLTTITEDGKTVKDLLVDKDFVSTARMCERDGGKVSMAIRYGSLTGQPGVVMTFDPADPKLKTTPLVDQRLASIHKTKLLAYGSIEPGAKKTTTSRTAKVPNDVVDLMPAWDGGLVLVETFLETAFEIPMGEAIAMRRLAGDVRTSYIASNDSIKWQHINERAFMTTAGQAYEGVEIHLTDQGLSLLYDHTPKGLDAINVSGQAPVDENEGKGKGKKDKIGSPAEAGVLKAVTLDTQGKVVAEGTALMHPDGYIPCPTGSIPGNTGRVFLVKCFDRQTTYGYALIDASKVGQ